MGEEAYAQSESEVGKGGLCNIPGSLKKVDVPAFDYLVAQTVKNLPAMRETWVQTLGWEDSLDKEMATHSSILAWRIP